MGYVQWRIAGLCLPTRETTFFLLEVNEEVRSHSNCTVSRWRPSSARRQFGSNNTHPANLFSGRQEEEEWEHRRQRHERGQDRKNRHTNKTTWFPKRRQAVYHRRQFNDVRGGAGSESVELIENVSLAAEGIRFVDGHVINGIRPGLHVTVPNDSNWQKAMWR